MHSLTEIRAAIEQLTGQRAQLLQTLAEAHDPLLSAQYKQLEDQIAQLWQEQRVVRARIRFGEPDAIIRQARADRTRSN